MTQRIVDKVGDHLHEKLLVAGDGKRRVEALNQRPLARPAKALALRAAQTAEGRGGCGHRGGVRLDGGGVGGGRDRARGEPSVDRGFRSAGAFDRSA